MREQKENARLRGGPVIRQKAAIVLLALLALYAAVLTAQVERLEADLSAETEAHRAEIERAERIRDLAVERAGALVLQAEQEREARAAQAAAYEAVGAYQYIGECTVTAYCPCEACCGPWADGLTSTGLPAGPGIVAVDASVIPLGSTVVIDGQRYLAADTGVTGWRTACGRRKCGWWSLEKCTGTCRRE